MTFRWELGGVLRDKYRFSGGEAAAISSFLQPMLQYDPAKRATAREMLAHPWLTPREVEEDERPDAPGTVGRHTLISSSSESGPKQPQRVSSSSESGPKQPQRTVAAAGNEANDAS